MLCDKRHEYKYMVDNSSLCQNLIRDSYYVSRKRTIMNGWKTWTGAGLVALGAVLEYFGMPEFSTVVITLGGALGLVGLGHKIEKSS